MFSSDITLYLPIGGTNLVLKGHAGMTPSGIEISISDVSFEGAAPAAPTPKRRAMRNAQGGRVIHSKVTPPSADETVEDGEDFDDDPYGVDEDELVGLASLVKFAPNNL